MEYSKETMNNKKKTMFRAITQRLKQTKEQRHLHTSQSEGNVPCLDVATNDVSMVAMPLTQDNSNNLTLVLPPKCSMPCDHGSDSEVMQSSPDTQTVSLPVTPVNSRHLLLRTRSWKESGKWRQSPDTKMKQRRTSAGIKQMLSKRDTFFDIDLSMMREDLDYWVFMRDGIDVDTDFEVRLLILSHIFWWENHGDIFGVVPCVVPLLKSMIAS